MKQFIVVAILEICLAQTVFAQATYQKPPQAVLDVLHAPAPPTVSLDPSRTTILLVEQNAHMALSVAARGYVLETGNLKVEGTTSQLLDNEEVRAAYLGGHAA